jgi:hypothetical protein
VIDCLSLNTVGARSRITSRGALHVNPPFVEKLAKSPWSKFASLNASASWCTRPFDPNETHGSVARWYRPPAQSVTPGIGTDVHDDPPFVLTPATSPREPPFDQRSCCQIPTRFAVLVGLTSIHGSTSLPTKTVPDCVPTASAVHPANGLAPDTWTSGPLVKVFADATPTAIASARSRGGTARKARLEEPMAFPLCRLAGPFQRGARKANLGFST